MLNDRNTELWRCVFETSVDAILVVDVETRHILEANPAASALFGYDRTELVGLLLDEVGEEPEETRRRFIVGDSGVASPRRFRRKDGSTFPAEVSINSTVMDGRDVRVGIIRNVELRCTAEEALRAAEMKYETAFHASPDAVNINRLSDGMYLEINEGFTALTGYTWEDVKGKTSADIAIWADPRDRDELVERLRNDGRADELQAVFRAKDGSHTIATMSARIIEVGGQTCILSVTRDISDRVQSVEELEHSNRRLAELVRQVAEALGRAVEFRDPYTAGHQVRVAELAAKIAVEMGLDADQIASVQLAAIVHDVGKLSVPAEILNKPGPLSAIEMSLIRTHPQQGYEILKDIDLPWPTATIVIQHHERLDGSGYPAGLSGPDILIPARIIGAADVVEAMASHRPYRPAVGIEPAIAELRSVEGRYDSSVLQAIDALNDRGELAFLVS